MRVVEIVSDPWQTPADDVAPLWGPRILSLSRLQQDEAVRTALHPPLGVALPVDQAADVLAPYLERLSLVTVCFPSFATAAASRQASACANMAVPARSGRPASFFRTNTRFFCVVGSRPCSYRTTQTLLRGRQRPTGSPVAYQPSAIKEPIFSGLRRATRPGVLSHADAQVIEN